MIIPKNVLFYIALLFSSLLYGQEQLKSGFLVRQKGESQREAMRNLSEKTNSKTGFEKDGVDSLYVFLELAPGVITYHALGQANKRLTFNNGAFIHFVAADFSKNLVLKTGVQLSRLSLSDYYVHDEDVFKFPFQAGYWRSKGKIRPRIMYGPTFYKGLRLKNEEKGRSIVVNDMTVALNAGATIRVTDFFNINAMAELESETVTFLLPSQLFAYSFQVGLQFKLF